MEGKQTFTKIEALKFLKEGFNAEIDNAEANLDEESFAAILDDYVAMFNQVFASDKDEIEIEECPMAASGINVLG